MIYNQKNLRIYKIDYSLKFWEGLKQDPGDALCWLICVRIKVDDI